MSKQGGKIACGQCHKFFKEDELILDAENNQYLCESCNEPRDTEDIDKGDIEDNGDEIDDEHCEECGNLKDD